MAPNLSTGVSSLLRFTSINTDTQSLPKNRPVQSAQMMETLLNWVARHRPSLTLPIELVEDICKLAHANRHHCLPLPPQAPQAEPLGPRRDPSKPPANGTCPFLTLPVELQQVILSDSLPDKHIVVETHCDIHGKKHRSSKPKPNRTSNLMVLNRHIKNVIKTIVYEEREFEIHVHEGLTGGGIEFLDAGRQPLQYLDELSDPRFARFKTGDEFGFNQLKKIKIVIFPASAYEAHNAINTYFMIMALVRMLERSVKESSDEIVSIDISFHGSQFIGPQPLSGRHAITRAESYWWDPDMDEPRCGSIHGLSDVELILRPFVILTKVHNVLVTLPSALATHTDSVAFVSRLTQSMTNRSGQDTDLLFDDNLIMQANAMRPELENLMMKRKYGGTGAAVGSLTQDDMQEDEDNPWEGFDRAGPAKHSTSPLESDGDAKRRKMVELGIVDEETYELLKEDFEVDMQEAIMGQLSEQRSRRSSGGHSLLRASSSVSAPEANKLMQSLHRSRSERQAASAASTIPIYGSGSWQATPEPIRRWQSFAESPSTTTRSIRRTARLPANRPSNFAHDANADADAAPTETTQVPQPGFGHPGAQGTGYGYGAVQGLGGGGPPPNADAVQDDADPAPHPFTCRVCSEQFQSCDIFLNHVTATGHHPSMDHQASQGQTWYQANPEYASASAAPPAPTYPSLTFAPSSYYRAYPEPHGIAHTGFQTENMYDVRGILQAHDDTMDEASAPAGNEAGEEAAGDEGWATATGSEATQEDPDEMAVKPEIRDEDETQSQHDE